MLNMLFADWTSSDSFNPPPIKDSISSIANNLIVKRLALCSNTDSCPGYSWTYASPRRPLSRELHYNLILHRIMHKGLGSTPTFQSKYKVQCTLISYFISYKLF